ncbi:hypothetical protein Leryth_005019 [Lithospermum erythrorhizon]|nr:hypothetical protein Leryth_005019 [Lithospermum erythrorhizon]
MWKPDTLVFAKADQTLMRILRKLRPYVDYGHLSLETIKFMIHNAAAIVVDNIRITRFTNEPALVEQAFGQYNIFTIEDIVNEIVNLGPHFEDVTKTIVPIPLDKSSHGTSRTDTIATRKNLGEVDKLK